MASFRDLLSGDYGRGMYDDDDEPANRRVTFDAPAEYAQRAAVQKVAPQVEGKGVGGFVTNFAKDVGRFAGGLGALLGEVALHPVRSAEAVGSAVVNPIDTAKWLAEPIIERYTPGEGESITGMLARTAYEHPFDMLLDASTVIQGPFGAAAKVAKVAGAAEMAGKLSRVSAMGRAIDPLSLAQKGGRAVLKKYMPDQYALTRTMRANTDALSEEVQRQRFLENDFATRALEAEAHLNPAEHAIKFAWGEGRVPIIKDDMITEITHRGLLESRKVEAGTAIRPEALEQWKAAYDPLRKEFEQAAGLAPEQYAAKMRSSAVRQAMYKPLAEGETIHTLNPDFNPFSPDVHQIGEEAYAKGLAEATERQSRRAAVSTITALDVAKEKAFREQTAQLGIDEAKFNAIQEASNLPHPWDTPTLEEALELMPNGGMIIHHGMQVLNREQSTVRNVLTKAQEASARMENAGLTFKAGLLQQHDPTAALSRAYRHAIRGDTFAKIAEDAAQVGLKEGLGVKVMDGKWNPHLDPDVIAGTHQPLHPGSLAQDGSITEHFSRLKERLLEVAPFDEAAAAMNLVDVAENMGAATHRTFPLNSRVSNAVYKIPKGMGDALAMFKHSFEPATNPLAKISDKWVMGPFNLMTLNMKGGRILNNAAGDTFMVAGQGLTPFTARGFMAMLTAGRASLGHFGVLKDEVSQKLAKVFELPGVPGGIGASDLLKETNDLGTRLAEGRVLEGAPRAVKAVAQSAPARGLGRWTQMMATANQNLENIYRAGSTIYEMTPKGMESVKGLIHGSATMADMGERFAQLRGMGIEALKQTDLTNATKGMNRWLNDYDRTSAFDRLTGRYVFPYHKFYKHSAELLLRAPFEKPIKAQLARRIGAAALQDVKDQLASYGYDWNTMVPEGMRTSVPVHEIEGEDGSKSLMMFNTTGLNPFSIVNMNGDIGGAMLNSLNPLIKIAIEQATGVNLFTREKFQGQLSTFNGRKIDPETGASVEDYERPPLVDHYLRQFWPAQTLRDIVAHGRQPRDGADLLDMALNRPGTYRLDKQGREIEKPRAAGALTPFVRFMGAPVGIIQPPTVSQARTQRATTAEQFSDLYQLHPEKRAELLAELRKAARERKRPAKTLPPRRG